jgi:hypothetical protein
MRPSSRRPLILVKLDFAQPREPAPVYRVRMRCEPRPSGLPAGGRALAALVCLAALAGCSTVPPDAPDGVWVKNGITQARAEQDRMECSSEAERTVAGRWDLPAAGIATRTPRTLETIYTACLEVYSACLKARGYRWTRREAAAP